jgi:YesN/AraC family two-component response regulator
MSDGSRIRVLIVTDNRYVGEGTRRLLEIYDEEIEVVGVARDGLEAARAFSPQVILMDGDMLSEMDRFVATYHITQEMPETQVIIVSAWDDPYYYMRKASMRKALRAGASDYYPKSVSSNELHIAILAAYRRWKLELYRLQVTITLEMSTQPERTIISGESRIRVLIVDDNVESLEGTRRLLEIYDKEIEVVGLARNGQEAIEMARAFSPQVILMETDMPVMDGFTATHHIIQEMPAVQVIIVSAQADEHYMRAALRAGVTDYWPKPVSSDELHDAILDAYRRWERGMHQLQVTRAKTMSEGSRIRVLIVDNGEEIRRPLEIYYDKDIEIVEIARNGLEAIEMAHALSPHVILMDIDVPEMDGLTATDHITQEMPAVQVVIVSAQDDDHCMREALRAGAVDFLVKGYSAIQLYSAVLGAYRRWEQYYQPQATRGPIMEGSMSDMNEGRTDRRVAALIWFKDYLALLLAAIEEGRFPAHPYEPFAREAQPLLDQIDPDATWEQVEPLVEELHRLVLQYELETELAWTWRDAPDSNLGHAILIIAGAAGGSMDGVQYLHLGRGLSPDAVLLPSEDELRAILQEKAEAPPDRELPTTGAFGEAASAPRAPTRGLVEDDFAPAARDADDAGEHWRQAPAGRARRAAEEQRRRALDIERQRRAEEAERRHEAEEAGAPEPHALPEAPKEAAERTRIRVTIDLDALGETRIYYAGCGRWEESERVANIVPLDADTREADRALRLPPGGKMILRIDIGERSPESIIAQPPAFPDDALPQDREGNWIDVLVSSSDFAVGDDGGTVAVGRLFLPVDQSRSSQAEDGGRYLHVAMRAPDRAGLAFARVGFYYRNNLLQGFKMVADVGSDAPMTAVEEPDFTLYQTMTAIPDLPPRRLNIVTNDNTDGSYQLVLRTEGEKGVRATTYKLDPAPVSRAIGELRKALKDVAPTRPERSKRELIEDLRHLARRGYTLWEHIMGHAGDDLALVDLLDSGDFTIIQVARPDNVSHMFPWGLLYDITIESGVPDHALKPCKLIEEWDPKKGQPMVPPGTHRCPSLKEGEFHAPNTLCPFGFWGFRYAIEQPSSTEALITEIPANGQGLEMSIALTQYQVDKKALKEHVRHLKETLGGVRFREGDTLAEIKDLLHDPDLQMLYFYCHGHGADAAEDTYLVVGNNEKLSSGDFIGWRRDWFRQERIRVWDKIQPLIFINACHSVDVTPESLVSLLRAFVKNGRAAGVIGTEVRVNQALAMAMAEAFFGLFVNERQSVAEALHRVQIDFLNKGNLFGLVYTPYCSADLKLK